MAALAVLLTAPLVAQQPSAEGVFVGRVEVNVVNIEVYVTDKDGHPVTGLTREDFELYEDGERVEITNFFAVEDGTVPMRATVEGPAQETERGSEDDVSAPAPAPPPEERRLHLVVYLDQFNLTSGHRNRTLEGLEVLLEERLTEGDRVMVVSSFPRFEILVPFTGDRQRVLDAVRQAQEVASNAGGLIMDRRMLELQIERAVGDPNAGDLARQTLINIRQYAQRAARELSREVTKLRSFTASLAGLPGRKAILHLSEGVPVRLGEDLFYQWESAFSQPGQVSGADGFSGPQIEAARFDLTPELQRLVQEANAAGVTFYTLDVVGPRAYQSVSAERRGALSGVQRLGGPETEAVQSVNAQTALQIVASGTGGVPILNANRPWVNLERVAETFDSYYSLGYMPEDPSPDEYRRLEVEVKRPGVRVRHRTGYEKASTAARVENATVAALLLGDWQNPLRAYLEMGEPERRKKKLFRVPVSLKIPLDGVVLLPGPGTHRGLLRVRVAFQKADGNGFGVGDELTVPIEIPNDEVEKAREKHFTVRLEVDLDPGRHRITVGVWDEVGAEASFLPYDLVVGERS